MGQELTILSIYKGSIQELLDTNAGGNKSVLSAINKVSVSNCDAPNSQFVGNLGLDGDEQANPEVHGGIDKAVYAYPIEHYDFWTECLRVNNSRVEKLNFGAFGENLTIQGFNESSVFVGDQWLIGSVLLEVVRFREPCFKFNIKMGWSGAAQAMVQSNQSGWYLKVLKTGTIRAGDTVDVLPGPRELSILIQSSSFYNKSKQSDLWS